MKTTLQNLFLAGALACALVGCNTTDTSTSSIAANQMGDGQMSCAQIVAEINEMNEILGIAEGEVRQAEALGLTEDVAINAALYSGALGNSVPYLGSIIGAAGQLNNMNKEQAEQRAREAYNRRAVLTGMHAAKGCQ